MTNRIETISYSTDLLNKEFCSKCGSLIPMEGHLDHNTILVCKNCSAKIPLKSFDGLTSTYRIKFNDPIKEKQLRLQKKLKEHKGPIVERRCPKCDSEQMYYFTMQTRSADEGQTVFYTCVKCNKEDIDYS